MKPPDHPVRGRKGRVVFHRERAPTPEEFARLIATRQRSQRATWSHIRDLQVIPLEGNAPERVLLSWTIEGPDPTGSDPSALADLVSRIARALPGTRVLVDDPLALISRHGARFVASRAKGSRPERLPTGWQPRAGTLLHQGPPRSRPSPPATKGQLLDFLGVLDVSALEDLDVVGLAAGPTLHPRFDFRNTIQSGVLAAAGLRALAALARAGIIPPTGLPEQALHRLEDGDYREREAARELLLAVHEAPSTPVHNGRPRLAHLGASLRTAWQSTHRQPVSRRSLGGLDPSAGRSRTSLVLRRVLTPLSEPQPDDPWPGRPSEDELPYLTRSERFDQVLRADAGERRTGALALAAVGGPLKGTPPGCFDAVVSILESPRTDTLDASLAALVLSRSAAPEAVRRLARLSSEAPDTDLACAAAEALGGQTGPMAREALRDALALPRVAAVAAETASRIGDVGALQGILALAESPDAMHRTAAARALARIGAGPTVFEVLDTLSMDENPNTARAARASRAVHRSTLELNAWARSASAPDLAAALELLGRRDRTDTWPVLCDGLRHPAPDVRAAAASALGWLELPGATPLLVSALSDKEPFVVVAVCAALARCADSRAVMPLRRMAAGDETPNQAARRALKAGRYLRSWAPDEQIYLRALAPAPLPLTVAGRLTSALQGPDLRCRVSAAGVSGEATISPDDIPGLLRVTAMLERAAEVAPDLRWSVRDGQHSLRRHGRRWTVSRRRGRVVRQAGWFDEPSRPTPSRPPLTPLHDNSDLILDSDIIFDDDLLLEEPLIEVDDDLDLGDELELEDSLELDDPEPSGPAPVGLAGLTTGATPETTESTGT